VVQVKEEGQPLYTIEVGGKRTEYADKQKFMQDLNGLAPTNVKVEVKNDDVTTGEVTTLLEAKRADMEANTTEATQREMVAQEGDKTALTEDKTKTESYERLSEREEKGRAESGEANIEATNVLRRVHQSGEQVEGSKQNIRQQEEDALPAEVKAPTDDEGGVITPDVSQDITLAAEAER